jgi:hypothetical protein
LFSLVTGGVTSMLNTVASALTPDPWASTAETAATAATGRPASLTEAEKARLLGAPPPLPPPRLLGAPPPLPPPPSTAKKFPIVPMLMVGAVGIALVMFMRRKPAANPRRRRNSASTWTVVTKHRDGVRRIPGYTSWKAASFAGQMFGGPFTIEHGNPARRRAHKRRRR